MVPDKRLLVRLDNNGEYESDECEERLIKTAWLFNGQCVSSFTNFGDKTQRCMLFEFEHKPFMLLFEQTISNWKIVESLETMGT